MPGPDVIGHDGYKWRCNVDITSEPPDRETLDAEIVPSLDELAGYGYRSTGDRQFGYRKPDSDFRDLTSKRPRLRLIDGGRIG
jgi:hypothetical protein